VVLEISQKTHKKNVACDQKIGKNGLCEEVVMNREADEGHLIRAAAPLLNSMADYG
jgi:hypothetical protein